MADNDLRRLLSRLSTEQLGRLKRLLFGNSRVLGNKTDQSEDDVRSGNARSDPKQPPET